MANLTLDVLDPSGASAGTALLPEEIFGVQTNVPLIHQVVVAQLAAARQGTHDTKNRGEVERRRPEALQAEGHRAAPARARPARRSSPAVAWCTARRRGTTRSGRRRR